MNRIEEITNECHRAKGLTRFFIDKALHSLDHPADLPTFENPPRIDRDYKKISFEGIKCAGKDYLIERLIKQRPDFVVKPKFKKIFPYSFLDDLRKGGIFGGVADSLLLASAYAYDEEYYVGKGTPWYVQSRGIYTFATMEIMRLEKETSFSQDQVRSFILDMIRVIGLPDIGIYLDVDLKTAIERSKIRNKKKSSKQAIQGAFLEEQKRLQQEYDWLTSQLPELHRLESQDVQKNIEYVVGLIDG